MKPLKQIFKINKNNNQVIDQQILFALLILLILGIVMVYSASIAYATNAGHNEFYYLARHLIYIAVGLLVGVLAFTKPTKFYQKYATMIAGSALILGIIVLIPHVGKVINGSRRWLSLGLFTVQPGEITKLAFTIFLTYYIASLKENISLARTPLKVFISLSIIILPIILLLLEPDLGSATVIFILGFSLLYVANSDLKLILGMLIGGIFAFIVLVIIAPYRIKRVTGFLDPWADALGKGYQLTHSLLAFGHGGWFGVGLGNSVEKFYYLPEAHTDFILAIIGEEFGFAGVMLVLIMFWLIFYRGFYHIASECNRLNDRKFQGLLAQGISIWFFVQALINMGVSLGVLPTKGLTLPFISFGGSSIIINLIAIAILLKIDYENRLISSGKTL